MTQTPLIYQGTPFKNGREYSEYLDEKRKEKQNDAKADSGKDRKSVV